MGLRVGCPQIAIRVDAQTVWYLEQSLSEFLDKPTVLVEGQQGMASAITHVDALTVWRRCDAGYFLHVAGR